MMLLDLVGHTDLVLGCLTLHDLSQLRQTCSFLKQWVENSVLPHTQYTWAQKCRLCDPQLLWDIDGKPASCYKPVQKTWAFAYWPRKLPPVVPYGFWNYFMRIMSQFVSMPHLLRWSSFEQCPLVVPPRQRRWEIGMGVSIVGTSEHEEEPEEWKHIDEFLAVGVALRRSDEIADNILGLNAHSIGWHSDDGKIYMDSFVVEEGEPFGSGDEVEVVLDYSCGLLLFKKNNRSIYLHELTGDMLSRPLMFSASCRTMNSLFFRII